VSFDQVGKNRQGGMETDWGDRGRQEEHPPGFSFDEMTKPVSTPGEPETANSDRETEETEGNVEVHDPGSVTIEAPPDLKEEEFPPEGEKDLEWYYRWGKQMTAQRRLHDAVEAYQQVLTLDAMHVKARNNLALIYDTMGLFDKALEELRTALELDPRNIEVRANLGALLGEHGRVEEAEREFKRALEVAPEDSRIRFNLGLVYFRKGLYARGIPEFERTLSLRSDHKEALYYLAQSYNLTGQYAKSMEIFEQLIEMDPDNYRAHWYLGMLHDRRREHDRARQYYQNSYRIRQQTLERQEE